MRIDRIIHQALRNMLAHRMRSLLAVLGICIGTLAMVTLLTDGKLATLKVLRQIESMGIHLVNVSISVPSQATPIDRGTVLTVLRPMHPVKRVAMVSLLSKHIVAFEQVPGNVIAVSPDFEAIFPAPIAYGRALHPLDDQAAHCVVGHAMAQTLKRRGVLKLIGYPLRIGAHVCTIVGVAKPWPDNFFLLHDLNRSVIMPMGYAQQAYQLNHVGAFTVELSEGSDAERFGQSIRARLHALQPKGHYFVREPKQILQQYKAQERTMTWLLGAIGVVALIVGGIGIMNVMLVSVSERTFEIGLRLALGATPQSIQRLFLIEAMVLSSAGGIVGVIMGEGLSALIAWLAGWDWAWIGLPMLLGLMVSMVIGLFFGVYPARRAAALHPVDALRTKGG